jgi:hypothetical protein
VTAEPSEQYGPHEIAKCMAQKQPTVFVFNYLTLSDIETCVDIKINLKN